LELRIDVHVRAMQLDEGHPEERDDARNDDPVQSCRRSDQPGDHRYLRGQRRDSACAEPPGVLTTGPPCGADAIDAAPLTASPCESLPAVPSTVVTAHHG